MRSDALRGHLEAMVLASLEGGPLHGYAISEGISRRTDALVSVPTGSLYPALHRLEKAGWVTSEWSDDTGRRRRTYELTRAGRAALLRQREEWSRVSGAITAALGGAG